MIIEPEVTFEATTVYRQAFAPSRGGELLIREATPEDAEGLRAMFARSSEETIYLRFHLPYPTVPDPLIALLTGASLAGRSGRAFVATSAGDIVGHAMYVRDEGDDREAEIGVVVEDGRQAGGVGGLLLTVASEDARRVGVEALTCFTLWENRRILELARRAFPGVHARYADGALRIRVPLRSATT